MTCLLHAALKVRKFNGKCWYCRLIELDMLAEIELEVFGPKPEPEVVAVIEKIVPKKHFPEHEGIIAIGCGCEADGLMPFSEIGKRLGITLQGAQNLCRNGLNKLRLMHPQACRRLMAIAEMRQKCLPRTREPW